MRRAGVIVCVTAAAIVGWSCAVLAIAGAWRLDGALHRAADLAEIAPRPQATVVFDRASRPVFSFYAEQRLDVPLDRVSKRMVDALLSVEDRRFYSHRGLDPLRIVSAAWRNWRAGRIVEGGSTLTQQLARTLQLSPERTFTRKLREATIAAQLEHRYAKDDILVAYLNTVYFGNGYYGVEAAARAPQSGAAADARDGAADRRRVSIRPRRAAAREPRDGRRHVGAARRRVRSLFPGSGPPRAGRAVRRPAGPARRASRLHGLRAEDAVRGGAGDYGPHRADRQAPSRRA